jgi:hypothetical protein
MKRWHILFCLLMFPCMPSMSVADPLDDGMYKLYYSISDMSFSRTITITNYISNTRGTSRFELLTEEETTHTPHTVVTQRVAGIVYGNMFHFAIPVARIPAVKVFFFSGTNDSTNGVFHGHGDVPYDGPNCGNNKFTFTMKRKAPNKPGGR